MSHSSPVAAASTSASDPTAVATASPAETAGTGTAVVSYQLADGVAVIQLDDGKANAITYEMIEAFERAFSQAQTEAAAIVITGRPGILTGGFDLQQVRQGIEATRAIIWRGGQLFTQILVCPKPVVIACTGHAVAGGAVLLLVGDLRIGSRGKFRIGLNEVLIGIGLPEFVIRVGEYRLDRRVCERALLGEIFGPESAVEAGFLDRIVPENQVVDEAITRARELAQRDAAAYAVTKTAARAGMLGAGWRVP